MNQTVQKKMAASPRKSTHKSPVTFFSSDRVNTWSAAPSQLEVRKGFGAFFFFLAPLYRRRVSAVEANVSQRQHQGYAFYTTTVSFYVPSFSPPFSVVPHRQ